MTRPQLTDAQKAAMYRNGYVVLKRIVPPEMVNAARRRLHQDMGRLRQHALGAKALAPIREAAAVGLQASVDPVILDLFNGTDVKGTMEAFLGGPVNAASGAQIAANYPTDPSERVNEAGYRDMDTPFYGWVGHLDGLWNGAAGPPPIGRDMTPRERRRWYGEQGTNGVHRNYAEYNANITNFTALVGIVLSDQRREGAGNLGLLRGAHHPMGEFFAHQQQLGGPLGPDGPDWPREHAEAPNRHGLRHFPEAVRDAYRRNACTTEDGRIWPKPTMVKASPGDAVIVHFNVPHSATRVEGPDPRLMIYFRVNPKRRTPGRVDPGALCNTWKEWRGMRDYVRFKERR